MIRLQKRVEAWIISRFTRMALNSRLERAMRLLEEAVELAQACNVPKEYVGKLADHVYSRPPGTVEQELAGVGVAALGFAAHARVSFSAVVRQEVERIEGLSIEHFRARQNAKADAGIAMGVDP